MLMLSEIRHNRRRLCMEHGKNLPGMILLIEDGSLSIRIHHHISLWVGTGKQVCGKNRHLSWWLSISWLMIARTFPWWKYSGDPSISCMSGEFLTTNLRLAHGAGSLTGCFPQAVSSAPLFRRHKKFGLGQNGKETDWTLLKLNFMLQTLKKHWVFSECLTCLFFRWKIARMSWWRSIKKMGRLVLPLARALWLLFQVKIRLSQHPCLSGTAHGWRRTWERSKD